MEVVPVRLIDTLKRRTCQAPRAPTHGETAGGEAQAVSRARMPRRGRVVRRDIRHLVAEPSRIRNRFVRNRTKRGRRDRNGPARCSATGRDRGDRRQMSSSRRFGVTRSGRPGPWGVSSTSRRGVRMSWQADRSVVSTVCWLALRAVVGLDCAVARRPRVRSQTPSGAAARPSSRAVATGNTQCDPGRACFGGCKGIADRLADPMSCDRVAPRSWGRLDELLGWRSGHYSASRLGFTGRERSRLRSDRRVGARHLATPWAMHRPGDALRVRRVHVSRAGEMSERTCSQVRCSSERPDRRGVTGRRFATSARRQCVRFPSVRHGLVRPHDATRLR